MCLFFKQESISCCVIAPCLKRVGGEKVVSTKVETFPPGAAPGSITRSISLPKIFKTSCSWNITNRIKIVLCMENKTCKWDTRKKRKTFSNGFSQYLPTLSLILLAAYRILPLLQLIISSITSIKFFYPAIKQVKEI